MNPWYGKALFLLATAAQIAIRAPHGRRSRGVPVLKRLAGRREKILLALVGFGLLVPMVWVFAPVLTFADYPFHPLALGAAVLLFAGGLLLFRRAHQDLGELWSVTLELREGHRLVTGGIYRSIRHPMYLSLFLFYLGQAAALPNWVAGPSTLLTFGLLYLLRVKHEERMMVEQFGAEYEEYSARTGRLLPRGR